ncbi:Distal rod protein [uncultured Clostridium sp.]|uniref:flagellar hook-basal body complex protein n=1 Tax=uncultured Clostridium sp. TaxID=59620 RepID=UPI0008230DFC|nr:flagellar hook-basal body complex protein [uncultured Clostridium sp.]SCJ98211.1 Distal rod protein [uncultured Clostridium sp.]
MYSILSTNKTGMSANQNKINIISNNIVNVNTTGYKKLEMEFQDLVRDTLNRDSYPVNNKNSTIGTGVKTSNEVRNFTQGNLKETKLVSNMAIDGEGLFRVIRPDDTYVYTRNGEFNIDSTGKIVDDKGNILDIQFEGNNNYLNSGITSENFTVNKSGQVFAGDNKIGSIKLYVGESMDDFLAVGDNLFTPKDGSNIKISNKANIMQGYVETSNVDISQEITELIAIQRAFQLNSKGITVADDMWSMINNLQSR